MLFEEQKQCLHCKTLKPFSEFHTDRTCKDKLAPTCKVCKMTITKQRYEKRIAENTELDFTKIIKCYRCNQELEATQFPIRLRLKGGFSTICKDCTNKTKEKWRAGKKRVSYHTLYKYSLTKEDYLIMLEKQNGVCAICKKEDPTQRLSVDHCHTTNKVRALLCSNCNTGLGLFKEDIMLMTKAINYLKEHHGTV